MACFTGVICRIYSNWMINICQIKVIFIRFKFSHPSWIKTSKIITKTIWSLFGKLKKCFYPWATFLFFNLSLQYVCCSFCIDIFSIDISIIYCRIFLSFFYFFDNTVCAYLRHYCYLQKSIDSHFLPHKLFFGYGAIYIILIPSFAWSHMI